MFRYICIILFLASYCDINAKNITRRYHDVPLSDVLRDIDNEYTDGNINFIFNELEDFTVTTTIIDKPVFDAIYEVIGFYPIRATVEGKDMYVECFRKERNRLTGRLVDENYSPVEYANVMVYNQSDSSFITSGISNQNGNFVIPTDARHVIIKTRCIGYMPFTGKYENGNIGTIRIHTNAKVLKEVSVERKTVQFDGNRIIVYPTTTQMNHSFDFFSLLSQLPFPALFVNEQQRDIRVYNKTPIILINGIKRSQRDLISIDPKNVARIEYSTDVPIKYLDGNDESGIIYIYLKQPKDGGSFYADFTGSPTTGFINADAGASYNQGKSEFAVDYNTSWRDYNKRKRTNIQSYIGDDFRADIIEKSMNAPIDYNDHNINFGYTYRYDKSMTVSAKFKNTIKTSNTSSNGTIQDSFIGKYKQDAATHESLYSPSLDLYVKKDWDNGHTLEAQVTGTLSDMEYQRKNIYSFDDGTTLSFPSEISNRFHSLISEISYEKIFSPKTSFHIGYQNHISHSINNYISNNYTGILDQNSNFLYLNLSQRIGKVSLYLGTGLKLMRMKSETNSRNFTRNLSTLNIGIPVGKKFNIGISGGYTPVIPQLSQLTDIYQSSNNYLITTGNPNLKVEHKLRGQIKGYYQHKKLNLGIITEYVHLINPMNRNATYLGNGQFLNRTENYDHYDRFEAALHVSLIELFDKRLSIQANTGYKYITTQSPMQNIYLNTFYSAFRVNVYLGKWSISSYYYLPNKYIDNNTIRKNENWSSLSLGFRPNKNWYLSLSGCLLFHPEGTEYPAWNISKVNPGYTYVSIPENGNMIMVSARYNISFGRIFGKTKRKLNNSDTNNTILKPE